MAIVSFCITQPAYRGTTADRHPPHAGEGRVLCESKYTPSRDHESSKGGKYLLIGQFGSYLAGSSVPVVRDVDFDDFLLIIRARRAVRTATTKGDTLARGWPRRVAWGDGVENETAFHGRVWYEGDPENK